MFGDIIKNTKNYKTIKIKDISNIKSGGTPSRKNEKYFKGNIPWITTIALGNDYIDYDEANEYITQDAINNSATKIIPKDSILFGTRVGVGKSSINVVPMCTNQDIVAITNIDSRFEKLFLKKALDQYSEYFNNQKRGATIQGITSEILKEINVPIVSNDLQNKYIEFVQVIDKQKFESMIKAENEIKKIQKNIYYKWGQ